MITKTEADAITKTVQQKYLKRDIEEVNKAIKNNADMGRNTATITIAKSSRREITGFLEANGYSPSFSETLDDYSLELYIKW